MDWLWFLFPPLAVLDIMTLKGRTLFAIGVFYLSQEALIWGFPEWKALQWTQTCVLTVGMLLWVFEYWDYRTVFAVEITMIVGVVGIGELGEWKGEQDWMEIGKDWGIQVLGLAAKYFLGIAGFIVLTGMIIGSLRFLTAATKQANTEAELGEMAVNSLSNLLFTVFLVVLGQAFLWLLDALGGGAPWLLCKWQDGLIAFICASLKAKEANNSPDAFTSTVICGFLSIQAIRETADWLG